MDALLINRTLLNLIPVPLLIYCMFLFASDVLSADATVPGKVQNDRRLM